MKPTKGQTLTMKQVYPYLMSKGIPKPMIQAIRVALIYDAVVEGTDLKYDRVYTAVALMLFNAYQLDADSILDGLQELDHILGSVLPENEGRDWTELCQELEDKTGLAIHTGSDDRLICEHTRPEKE